MRVTLTEMLGYGTEGEVWATDCGRAVKLAGWREAVVSDRIRRVRAAGHELPHLPDIIAIFPFGDGYGVLRPMIDDLPISNDTGLALDYFNRGWFCEDDESLKISLTMMPDLKLVLDDLHTFFREGELQIIDLAKDGNVGFLNGKIVIRDVGSCRGIREGMLAEIDLDDVVLKREEDIDLEGPR